MKKVFCRALSIVLCLSLLFSVSSAVSFADGTENVPERGTKEPFRISVAMNGSAESQRGFCWYTKDKTGSKVEIIDAAGNAAGTISATEELDWNDNYMHKVTVSGLTPGKTYSYRVGDGTNWSDYGKFVTDDGDDSFSFVEISDVQASNDENFFKGAQTLEAALYTVPDAEFVMNCGDFTNDSTNEEWDYYDKNFGALNLRTTIVPVAGNHDGLGVKDWFNNMFNLDTSEAVETGDGVNYSFDYGNAHIAVLNTNDMLSISLSQLKWLKNDMDSTSKDWKIIAMHKTPYTLGKDGKWPDALYLTESLAKVCDLCGVDIVISGHDHMYLRTKPIKLNMENENGTTYVLSGTAGTKRYEIREFLAGFFLNTKLIGALNIQKNNYGNYWNGSDWKSVRLNNIGGCFNSVTIKGGTLTFNSYILSDTLTDETFTEQGNEYSYIPLLTADSESETLSVKNRLITKTDSFTITKETGKNKATFTGDNTTSKFEYVLGAVPSFLCLAIYTFGNWLPRFLLMAPKLIYVYITQDTF